MPTMFIVSCRRDFWSATDFSQTDEIREVDPEDDGRGQPVPSAGFLAAMAGKRVTVLLHGYNNERLDVLASYGAIDREMRRLGFLGRASTPYDAIIGYVWPGGATGVSFPFARGRAGDAAPRFGRLLTDLGRAGATVDLNTHSLGAHVAFEALRLQPGRAVRNAWNFASAVDNESVERGERYYEGSQRCQRFYVFHSKNDPVLRVWYRVGDFFDFDTALGYSGPEDAGAIMAHSPNVRIVNCKDVVSSHGGYRSTGQVWSFMARELTSPASDQFITLVKTPEALRAVFRATGGRLRPSSTRRARRTRRAKPRRATRRRSTR